MLTRFHARTIDGAPVVAVFRPRLVVPLVVLSGMVFLLVIAFGVGEPGILRFALVAWGVGAVPILISRRAAAIFTTESFLVRRPLARTARIPLKGIKGAGVADRTAGEGQPTLRIQLLVGGEMSFDVPDLEAVVYLLNKGAGQGLQVTPYQVLHEKN